MIKIKKVNIKNFLSVENASVEFDKLGLCLVKGENGTGKSTIYRKSLEYLLFGTIPEKLKADDFLSDFSPKDSCVYGKLVIETPYSNEQVTIWRYRNHNKHGNKIILNVNGKDVSKTDNRETQKLINNLLGIDFNTFESSTCFNSKAILFAESGAAGRSSLLSNILNLSIYEQAYNKVHKELIEVNQHISTLISEKKSTIGAIEYDKKILEAIELERVDDNKGDINQLKERVRRNKEKIANINSILKGEGELKTRIKEKQDNINKLLDIERNAGNKLSTLSSLIHHIRTETRKIKAGHICNLCKQKISQEHAEEQYKKAWAAIVEKEGEAKKIDEHLTFTEKTRREEEEKRDELIVKLEEVKDRLVKYSEISQAIKHDEATIKQKELFEEKISNTIKIANDNIEIAEDRLNTIELKLLANENNVKILNFWKEGFSRKGIPNLLIDKSLGRLQLNTNNYLAGSGLEVELFSQRELKSKEKREEIDITVYNNGQKRNYDNLSAGEKKRVDIAFMFAIMDLSPNKFNVSIMDEVFDSSLDSAGEELVFDILKERRKEIDSIIVISHQSNLQDLFENVITITKMEGKSNVVRGRN